MSIEQLAAMDPGELARILHVPILKAFIGLEVRDARGRVIHSQRQQARSWNRNFYNMLFTQGAAVAGDSARDLQVVGTGGTTYSSNHSSHSTATTYGGTNYGLYCEHASYYGGFHAPIGESGYGIVVGTGTNEEAFDYDTPQGYQLQSRIDNGNGAGQLAYQASSSPAVSTIGTTKRAVHERILNNNSGGDITVNEVAWYARACVGGDRYRVWMPCRDRLAAGVTVPDTGQLRVTYTIELTYLE